MGVAVTLLVGACRSQKIDTVNMSNFNPATVCLSQGGDGTLVVRAWGKGANKSRAIEQARRKAVQQVLFSGFDKGVSGAERLPLITEVNAAERYSYYFNPFFSEGGDYRKYARERGTKDERAKTDNGGALDSWGAVFEVDRAALRQRLVDDGILKP